MANKKKQKKSGLFKKIKERIVQFLNETFKFLFSDRLQKILTLVIASAAFWVAFNQGDLEKKHKHLSVKPDLQFTSGPEAKPVVTDTATFFISLANNGLGSARIKSFDVLLKNDTLSPNKLKINRSQIFEYALHVLFSGEKSKIEYTSLVIQEGSTIPQNKTLELLSLKYSYKGENQRLRILNNLRLIGVKVRYVSMYGDDINEISLIKSFTSGQPYWNKEKLIEEAKKYFPK